MGAAAGIYFGLGLLMGGPNQSGETGAGSDAGAVARRYDQLLTQAYEQNDPNVLTPVATTRQIDKVRLYMALDQEEKKRRIVTDLKRFTVKKVEKKGARAVVVTTETWEYYYRDLKTDKESGRTTETYEVTFGLVKKGNGWLVDDLDAKLVKS